MNFNRKRLNGAIAATGLSLALVACGGSEPASSSSDAPVTSEVESAVEDVAANAAETVEETVEASTEAVEEVVEDVADTAEDVVEAAVDETEAVVEDVVEAVEDAAEDASDAVAEATETASNDLVSPEIAAQYAALTGDAGNGRRVFTQCMSCHAVQEGRNMAGPSLYGIVGRSAGTIPGFRYSDANANSGIVWTEETMFAYLEQPQAFIPGTFMAFPGLPRPQDRADVIAYLKEQSE
ncbi:MAG: cytochrome c family protein [Pseudomonadota bacterium]